MLIYKHCPYKHLHEMIYYISRSKKKINRMGYLAFRGPCIEIYSYNKNEQDAIILKFILV